MKNNICKFIKNFHNKLWNLDKKSQDILLRSMAAKAITNAGLTKTNQ